MSLNAENAKRRGARNWLSKVLRVLSVLDEIEVKFGTLSTGRFTEYTENEICSVHSSGLSDLCVENRRRRNTNN
jgi:hypothetical protein